ncbi:MAG: hypothetical protein IPN86_24125 [Saprospiraceae bacterium]|nr:hypothetical protein [Saprospiraceae bacterium]
MGLETFDTSSKYIAADVNNDTKISASDLVELRKLILGINERFSNNKSWRFCSELPSFNPSSKIIINEKYKVGQGSLDITDLNFKGIKIGDINNDSNINEQPDNRTNQDCEFKYSLQKYGNVYELEIFFLIV